jgi:hypothetical protein
LPFALRRLLYRAIHLFAHTRHAERQASWRALRAARQNLGCKIFAKPSRPGVCSSLQPSADMCGENREQAMFFLQRLESLTAG